MWRCAGRRFVPLLTSRTLPSIGRSSLPQKLFQPVPVCAPALTRVDCWFSSQPPKPSDEAGLIDDDEDESLAIATGLEREELLAERQGKKLFDLDPPRGPFGTKEHPAIVQSNFDERIVGCSGGIGEDEHDVVWFKLKKGEPYECTVCTQVFQLEVVGPGGLPGGHHHH